MKKFISLFLISCLALIFSAFSTKTVQAKINNIQNAESEEEPLLTRWTTLKAYNLVNSVGEKLLESNGINKTIVFTIISNEVANASTDIHDEVRVHTGLLKYVETEDELAAVLGHEIGHAINKDVKHAIGLNIARSSLIIAGGVAMNMPQERISKATTSRRGLITSSINKNAEHKADLAGVDMLVKAGYNPLAEISILNKIAPNHYGYSSSHPKIAKRLKKIYSYIETNYPEYIQEGFPTVSYKMALKIIKSDKTW